jgi:hypothetical protein
MEMGLIHHLHEILSLSCTSHLSRAVNYTRFLWSLATAIEQFDMIHDSFILSLPTQYYLRSSSYFMFPFLGRMKGRWWGIFYHPIFSFKFRFNLKFVWHWDQMK